MSEPATAGRPGTYPGRLNTPERHVKTKKVCWPVPLRARDVRVGSHSSYSSRRARQGRAAQFVVLREFLLRDELAALLEHTLSHEGDFRPATAKPPGARQAIVLPYFRRARVLHELGRFSEVIGYRVESYLPWVLQRLGLAQFAVSRIEAEITASNDGEFLKKHVDSSTDRFPRRVLNYVYYFNRKPRRFSGGELRLYHTSLEDGRRLFARTFDTVLPENNQIVFFPACVMHEVRPVRCPSRLLADGRFTFNGSVWR
jgi:SM-20-related protein